MGAPVQTGMVTHDSFLEGAGIGTLVNSAALHCLIESGGETMAHKNRMEYARYRPGSAIPACFLTQILDQGFRKNKPTSPTAGQICLLGSLLVTLLFTLSR